jgi:hypothetical protein
MLIICIWNSSTVAGEGRQKNSEGEDDESLQCYAYAKMLCAAPT